MEGIESSLQRDDSQSDIDENSSNSGQVTPGRPTKKVLKFRYYNESIQGPYEVIIQDNKVKINPFHIGKIIKNHDHAVDSPFSIWKNAKYF